MNEMKRLIRCLFVVTTILCGFVAWADKEMLYCLHLEGDATNSGTAGSDRISGTPTWVSDNGKFGAQSVKGSSGGYIIADTDGLASMADGWTLSFWVNPNGLADWRDVCGFKIGDKSFKIEKNGANAFQLYNNGGDTGYPTLSNAISFTPNQWMNLVFVAKDENSFDIYADGRFVQTYRPNGETLLGGFGAAAVTQISIGTAGLHDERTSTALVDEVALYNFSATPAEVEWLAANQPSDYLCTFVEKTLECGSSATASAANADGADVLTLSFTDGATFTFDEELTRDVIVICDGSITLQADVKPSAEQLAHLDCSGVRGAVKRTWLTPGVVGFNFNANAKRQGQNNGTLDAAIDTRLALEIGTWYKDADSASGSSTAMFADGFSTLTWKSANVWSEAGTCTTFIQGYLDDGNGGTVITLSNVPYEIYDLIIYCSTDDSTKSFTAKTVNGTIYTWDSEQGAVVTTDVNATWGLASAAAGKAVLGANTIRINNLTGPLSIAGGTNGNNARGCIAAIQIMPVGTSTTPELTLTADADWTTADNWNLSTAPTGGNVIIHVTGDVTLTVDETVELGTITVDGDGSLTLQTAEEKTLTASAIGGGVPVALGDRVSIETVAVTSEVTWLTPVTALKTRVNGYVYKGGAGTADARVSLGLDTANGSMTLADSIFYLNENTFSGTQSTVLFTNATVDVSVLFGVGQATYVLAGTTKLTTEKFWLSQGAAGRTSVVTLKDTASVTVTGSSNTDQNTTSIMFGHWDGPSTFTIQDSAVFSAPSAWVLVGKTANNHTININGGTFKTKGIRVSSSATGTNSLNLSGGELILGAEGIQANGSRTMAVTVTNNPKITTTADCAITQPMSGTGAITKDGDSVLTLVAPARPGIAAVEAGSITVKLSAAELAAGEVRFPHSTIVDPDKALFSAVNSSGEPIAILSATVTDGDLVLALEVNEPFTTNTQISTWNETLTGSVVVDATGVEGGLVLDCDAALPAGVTEIVLIGDITLRGTQVPSDRIRYASVATLTYDPGEGNTVTTATSELAYTGPVVIASGTVKMGHAKCFGPWGATARIRVKSGATLDTNGIASGYTRDENYAVILEEGAVYTNTKPLASNADLKVAFPVYRLILQGDAEFAAGVYAAGLGRWYNYETPIAFNGYTLTKTGSNLAYISCLVGSGDGVFRIAEGTVQMAHKDGGTQPSFAEGTVRIDSGASLRLEGYTNPGTTFTVKNVELDGTVAFTSANCWLSVTGAISGSGTTAGLTLGANAVIKPNGVSAFTVGSAIVSQAEGGVITIDTLALDLTKTSKIPLFKVTDAANLPAAELIAGVPAKWNLVKTSNGLGYDLRKPSFTLSIK